MTMLITVIEATKDANAAQSLLSTLIRSQSLAPFTTCLTSAQLEALRRCAKGISLRFEDRKIVDALIAAGYVERGVAGVVTVTAKGREHLRAHAS
jgi:hypothetical protein